MGLTDRDEMRAAMSSRSIGLITAVGLGLSGCAGKTAFHRTAAISSAITNDMKTGMNTFVESQNCLNEANSQRLQSARNETMLRRLRSEGQLAAWRAADDGGAVQMYQALAGQSWPDIFKSSAALRSLQPLQFEKTADIDPAQYDALIRKLTALAQNASLEDRISFLVGFGKDISTEYKKALEKAASDTDQASKAGTAASKSLSDKAGKRL